MTSFDDSTHPLNRSIDRFLFADGWRVSTVAQRASDGGFDVTLTKIFEPDRGRSVTRFATSKGEAVLKACSSARLKPPVS